MKKVFITILLAALLTPASAQDTVDHARRQSLWAPASALSLLAAGTAFTYVPPMRQTAVELRDALQSDNHSRVRADDYVQYLPAATAPLLNICGMESAHTLKQMALLEGGSYLLGALLLNAGKYGLRVLRPDGSSYNSFPSGHTFTAFTGAEVLRREYGAEYPALAVAGYALAAAVGAMRMYNNRHWLGDVLAGAGLGVLTVSCTYWIADRHILNKNRKHNTIE